MKKILASAAATSLIGGLMGGAAFAQSIVLVPQGEGPAGQERFEVAQATQGQDTDAAGIATQDVTQATVGTTEGEEYGTYLTGAEGRAVYMLEADQQGTDDTQAQSTCTDACAETWPPLLTQGDPAAEGEANAALLSTIEREDGGAQVTYNGWPLYYYAKDEGSDQPTGNDVTDEWGEWYLVQPSGEHVEH